jgi:hypothetical protein
MSKRFALAASALSGTFMMLVSQPATAQVEYGKWKITSDCRTIRAPVGPGRDQIEVPQVPVPGRERSMECKWERDVIKCPRLRDKARHPIRCSTGKQTSGYSLWEPKA